MTWDVVEKVFNECKELLNCHDVELVSNKEWEQVTGIKIGDNVGWSNLDYGIITIVPSGLSLSEIREVTIHEIMHILFPYKPHYWIECFSFKVAKSQEGFLYYTDKYNHSPKELPKREKLIEMARRKAEGKR